MTDDTEGSIRRFLNASFATYRSIPRNNDAQIIDEDQRAALAACSQQFRKHLRRLGEEVSSIAECLDVTAGAASQEQQQRLSQLEGQYDQLYSIEKSWHVCEIFTINPNKMLSVELIRWLKDICYPPSLGSPIEAFLDSDEPEQVPGYWEALYQCVMQGNMRVGSELLQLHSEIANAPASGTAGTVTRGQADTVLDLFHSHPFHSLTSSAADGTVAGTTAFTMGVAAEFANWQNRVRKVRQSGMPVLTSIPELDTVLRVLLGESAALEHCAAGGNKEHGAEWGWAKLAIAQLLYVHPPPLGRQDLSRVLEQCMSSGLPSTNALEKGYVTTLREVMVGNVGPTLRSLYQLSRRASNSSSIDSSGVMELVPLLSTAHLSLLLLGGTGSEDLLIPLGDGPVETSFFEEVFLEAAQGLCAARLAPEVMLQYLAVCPQRGREYARVLLPRMCAHTDRSVLAVARLLRDNVGWPEEADALLRARAAWWLARSAAPAQHSAAVAGGRQRALTGSTLAKVARLYLAAGDQARVSALLEASLSRCMHAVASCSGAFPGLAIHPTACGPFEAQLLAISQGRGGVPSTAEDRLLELEAALVEAVELLQAVDPDLDMVITPDSVLWRCRSCLETYVAAVQTRFAPGAGSASFLAAAAQLSALVTDSSAAHCPTLPMRHWLHVLELITWLCNGASSMDNGVVHSSAADSDGEGTKEGTMDKEQAYGLLVALQELECSYAASDMFHAAAPAPVVGSAEAIRTLRLSLLGVLCASAVQSNAARAVVGAGAVAMDGTMTKSFADLHSGRATVSLAMRSRFQRVPTRPPYKTGEGETALQEVLAYELLTGATFSF